MEKPYFSLMSMERSQFASDFLFETAQELQDRFLKGFEKLINDTKSPHMKHFVKIIEEALRAKKDGDLVLNFNEVKAENAALKELFLETSSHQNDQINVFCFEMKKFFKSKSHASIDGHFFEKSICGNLGVVTELFYGSINDPELFHQQKKAWLIDFNTAKSLKKSKVQKPQHM
jgi:hypothetical protein